MTVSELIILLEGIKKEHGDLPVVVDSMSHTWPPDPIVRERGAKVLVLNG